MKKLLALFLASLMLLGLAACGGTTTTTPDVLDSDTVETPETPDTPSDSTGEVKEEWEGDYETATFADVRKYGIGSTKWDGSLPLSTTKEVLEIGLPTSTSLTDYNTNTYTLWLEEQTGVDVVIKEFAGSSSDISTQISLMLNGGEDMPDIINTKHEGNLRLAEYVEADYLQNVAGYYMTDAYYFSQALDLCCGDDVVKRASIMNSIENYATNMQTGQVFGPVYVRDCPTDLIQTEAYINMDWLNKLGLSKPTTVDELYDVLVAFRDRDPNGNGKKDEVPLMGLLDTLGRGVESYLINAFVQHSFDRKAMIEDGVAFSVYDTDEYRQALIYINKLVKEGLMSEMVFTAGSKELRRMLNPTADEDATVGIVCAWATGDFQSVRGNTEDSIYHYDALPALADATGRGGYSIFAPAQVRSRWSICWDCEKPQLAFRLLDFMSSPESYLRQRWGERGVAWDWIEDTQYKDMAEGNGVLGGTAKYVAYKTGLEYDSHWAVENSFQDEWNWQVFVNPEANDFVTSQQKLAAANVILQRSIGAPEEEFTAFLRTAEEDELFAEYNTELGTLVKKARNEFCMNRRDPNSDADWEAYLKELEALKYERWAELAQASYDRQMADLEVLKASLGK